MAWTKRFLPALLCQQASGNDRRLWILTGRSALLCPSTCLSNRWDVYSKLRSQEAACLAWKDSQQGTKFQEIAKAKADGSHAPEGEKEGGCEAPCLLVWHNLLDPRCHSRQLTATHPDPGLMRNAAAKWSKLSQAEKDAYGERHINSIAFSDFHM